MGGLLLGIVCNVIMAVFIDGVATLAMPWYSNVWLIFPFYWCPYLAAHISVVLLVNYWRSEKVSLHHYFYPCNWKYYIILICIILAQTIHFNDCSTQYRCTFDNLVDHFICSYVYRTPISLYTYTNVVFHITLFPYYVFNPTLPLWYVFKQF